jgi:hypothetical protein
MMQRLIVDAQEPVNPANGYAEQAQGGHIIYADAVEDMQPFRMVVPAINGVALADTMDPTHEDILMGIALGSPATGVMVGVATSGLVVNTNVGLGGWNFSIKGPVYVGEAGIITQVLPVLGWSRPIGFALSSNSIMLRIPTPAPVPAEAE